MSARRPKPRHMKRRAHRRSIAGTLAISLALVSGGASALTAQADDVDDPIVATADGVPVDMDDLLDVLGVDDPADTPADDADGADDDVTLPADDPAKGPGEDDEAEEPSTPREGEGDADLPDTTEIADDAEDTDADGDDADSVALPAPRYSFGVPAPPEGLLAALNGADTGDDAAMELEPLASGTPLGTAEIRVPVGSDRVGSGSTLSAASATPVNGVTVRLYAGGSAPNPTPIGYGWATAITGDVTDGVAVFRIPVYNPASFAASASRTHGTDDSARYDDDGAAWGARFWVKIDESSIPTRSVIVDGERKDVPVWDVIDQMRVGSNAASPDVIRNYQFRTTTLGASDSAPYRTQTLGTTTGFRAVDGEPSGSYTASTYDDMNITGGALALRRANPELPSQCGLDISVVVDLSSSMTEAAVTQARQATAAFLEGLEGTPSSVTVHTFATDANSNTNASQTVNRTFNMALGASETTRFTNWASGWSANGWTNWDRGLAAAYGDNSDLVVFITDGNPTHRGDGATSSTPSGVVSGNVVNWLRDVEAGVFAANLLKAPGVRAAVPTGSHVLAIGVGTGVTTPGSLLNLQAVSGERRFLVNTHSIGDADYMATTDFGPVKTALRTLALKNCTPSLNVTKFEVPATTPDDALCVRLR